MSEDLNAKNALANFLGFAASKAKELERAVVPGSAVSKTNVDATIHRAASEIEQRFSGPAPIQQPVPQIQDLASTLIPMPELVAQPDHNATPNSYSSNQLEFNFTDPSPQTDLIISEVRALKPLLNKILKRLDDLEKNVSVIPPR